MKFHERERIQREKEDEKLATFPFSPQIQYSTSKLVGTKYDRPPIYQRVSELQRELTENKNNIKLSAEANNADLTFKPQINKYSLHLAETRKKRSASSSFQTDSYDRKYNTSHNSFDQKCAFAPQVSSYGASLPGTQTDFLKRQRTLQEKSATQKEEMITRLHKTSCNFTPEINKVSKYITQSDKSRMGKNIEERLIGSLEKNRSLKVKLQEEHFGSFRFEPSINTISKSIGRSTSLNEIANNRVSSAKKMKKLEEKAADEERKHSFTPTTTKSRKFEYISSSYKQSERLSDVVREEISVKQRKIDEDKRIKEIEEMKECTFTPSSTGGRFYHSGKVSVKGIDRFFELKAIAHRRDQETKQREERVFFKNPKGNSESFHTVPRPFNIQPSNKKQKIERVRQEIQRKEQQECVFHPRTTE